MTGADEIVSLASRRCGTGVMVGVACVYLVYSAYKNITRWWKREISGKRCIKNVLDAMFTTGAGIAGGVVGGFLLGPIGSMVCGIVGGWVSAAGGAFISDYLTQKLFGLPQEEALENAYRYLDVEMTASNAKVNTSFRKLCLQHHPDKGGQTEEFFILQAHMAIIKASREDEKTTSSEQNIPKSVTHEGGTDIAE